MEKHELKKRLMEAQKNQASQHWCGTCRADRLERLLEERGIETLDDLPREVDPRG